MTPFRFRRVAPTEIDVAQHRCDDEVLERVRQIVDEVRQGGEAALKAWAIRLDDWNPDDPLIHDASSLAAAAEGLPEAHRAVLERTADRIRRFAVAQREALGEVRVSIPGGVAGHRVTPVERAGCYAPGGRFPLPSSVLMTAVTARAAGVGEVWVASPRPTPETLAAAAVAGADGLIATGGAQAVAALAFGVGGVPRCDIVVGPGNQWVTAAKRILFGDVGIDLLAGPTELVVLADDSADPALVAADLLAQAEHAPEARPLLVTTDEPLLARVEAEVDRQLADLATRAVAAVALQNGFAVVAGDLAEAVAVVDGLAPEHLEVMTRDAASVARRCRHFGGLFVGSASAEVIGDYGAGPNHTLPTGGAARFSAGLSVFSFLRVQTWLEIQDSDAATELYDDAAALAAMEGLVGHAAAARARRRGEPA